MYFNMGRMLKYKICPQRHHAAASTACGRGQTSRFDLVQGRRHPLQSAFAREQV